MRKKKGRTRWRERTCGELAFKEIATAFTIVFVAEFGDLTQIQAVNFTIKTHQPFEVFPRGIRRAGARRLPRRVRWSVPPTRRTN
jgi:putative Ca2+/H+ antiporter (TMEM165/GDT1 family)